MSEYPLPLAFIESMRPLLSGEMDAFLASYQQPAQRSVRWIHAVRCLPIRCWAISPMPAMPAI